MPNITIKFNDGTKQEFLHKSRPGGSYTNSVRYEGAFVIIRDEWNEERAFPAINISEVSVVPDHAESCPLAYTISGNYKSTALAAKRAWNRRTP